MTFEILGLAAGAVLFAVLERKRVRKLRDRYAEYRRRAAQAKAGRALSGALGEAGFFDGVPSDAARQLRADIEAHGYGGVFSHPWRCVQADDEELAEGQVGPFLERVAPALKQLGVAPLMGTSRFEDGGAHLLELPGETITLVSAEEARDDEWDGGSRSGFSWGAVGARVLERLNAQLAAAGRDERFYSVYGGNDAQTLLLNPAMLAAIRAVPGVRPDEVPYVRTALWPHFGAPQMPVVRRPTA